MNVNFSITTGTGRCGTQFLSKLVSLSKGVVSRHDPNPLSLTFHRYCKWNNLPVDDANFFLNKEREISEDLAKAQNSIHSSAHMAFSIEDLYKHFGCKVIILYRHPADVVNSYLGKGYYEEEYRINDVSKAIGYQPIGKAPHHFFGRIVPKGEQLYHWQKLSRVAKIAWMWSAVNEEIARQIATIPAEKVFTSKIEDLDYAKYLQLASFLGIEPVTGPAFHELVNSRPNRLSTSGKFNCEDWTEPERREFNEQIRNVNARLGYEIDFTRRPAAVSEVDGKKHWMDAIKNLFSRK